MADNKTQIIIKAKDETRAAFQSVQASLGNLEKYAVGLTPILAGISGALSAASFASSIDGAIKFAAAIDDMAERTGASVENLSALSGVAKIGGHDMALVEKGIKLLNKALHDTDDESKGAQKAIAAIGLSVKDLRDLDPAEAFLQVSKALDKFADGGGKSAAAMAIIKKIGADLLPFMKDLAEKSELVGKVTAEQAAQAEIYEKNVNKLAASFGALAKTAAMELVPALASVTSQMVAGLQSSGGWMNFLRNLGSLNTFQGIPEQLKNINAEAAKLEDKISIGRGTKKDEERLKSLQSTQKMLKAIDDSNTKLMADALGAKDIEKKPTLDQNLFGNGPKDKKPKAAKEQDDYSKLIASLNEKIAVETLNIETVGKATQAEKDYAKYQADVASGAIKLTAEQQRVVEAYYDTYIARQKDAKAASELNKAIEDQTEAMRRYGQSLDDELAKLQKEAELYGLSESAIASRTAALFEDAIATARANGALDEHVTYLEKELELRKKISDASDKKDVAAILSQTEDYKQKKDEAKRAQLSRALAAGDISQREYEQGMKVLEKTTDEMGEFMKEAARNAENAMAEFFISPTRDGISSIGETFAKTLQKMIAQAASAQLLKLMLGDVDKTGEIGGFLKPVADWAKSIDFKSIGSSIAEFFSFAEGGIMTSAGPLPLHKYATGGIANSPQLAMFGEGSRPEAYVPLPDGRRIPVAMQGRNPGNIVVNVNSPTGDPAEIRRSAAAGARTALNIIGGSRRYG